MTMYKSSIDVAVDPLPIFRDGLWRYQNWFNRS